MAHRVAWRGRAYATAQPVTPLRHDGKNVLCTAVAKILGAVRWGLGDRAGARAALKCVLAIDEVVWRKGRAADQAPRARLPGHPPPLA